MRKSLKSECLEGRKVERRLLDTTPAAVGGRSPDPILLHRLHQPCFCRKRGLILVAVDLRRGLALLRALR